MSAKAIREWDAKLLVAYHLARAPAFGTQCKVRDSFKAPNTKCAQVRARSPSCSTTTGR